MISKSLIILSALYSLVGFNLSSGNVDNKIADYYSKESYTSASATEPQASLPEIRQLPFVKPNAGKAYANSRNYALIDGDTGEILATKDAKKRVPIASTTKIMTAVVSLENYGLDDVVTVPAKATAQTPTVVLLRTNEKITVSELLHCLLIKSGNDSAYALASNMDSVGTGDNILPFIEKMNEKAKELGMEDTNYKDPAGLSDEGYSSAENLAIITRYALKNPLFRQIVTTKNYVASNTSKTIFHKLENSNRLVTTYEYPGAIGVKTGFTFEASHCLVGAATRNGHTLIAVILGTYVDSATASADEARRLLDWGFANIVWEN